MRDVRRKVSISIDKKVYKTFKDSITKNFGTRKMNLIIESDMINYVLLNSEIDETYRIELKEIRDKNKELLRAAKGGK